jgi:hypothetical protein
MAHVIIKDTKIVTGYECMCSACGCVFTMECEEVRRFIAHCPLCGEKIDGLEAKIK